MVPSLYLYLIGLMAGINDGSRNGFQSVEPERIRGGVTSSAASAVKTRAGSPCHTFFNGAPALRLLGLADETEVNQHRGHVGTKPLVEPALEVQRGFVALQNERRQKCCAAQNQKPSTESM